MPDLKDVLKSKEAAALATDTARLEKLRDAPEPRKRFPLLTASAGGEVEPAATPAAAAAYFSAFVTKAYASFGR